MAIVSSSPQNQKLMKTVASSFRSAGWKVTAEKEENYDFRVDCDTLSFFVKCVDSTSLTYHGETKILWTLDRYVGQLRSRRQLIVIFDKRFLSVSLDTLKDRGIFALTVDDIQLVTGLSAVSRRIPGVEDTRQIYLLERCVKYAVFVSQQHRKNGDFDDAIKWGRLAVTHSTGFNHSYSNLFGILKDAGDYAAAAELGQTMQSFKSTDPSFLRAMEDLSRKLSNQTEASQWRERLANRSTMPRTLNDILAKQRAANGFESDRNAEMLSSKDHPRGGFAKWKALFRPSGK
jgi:hypothetical protein